MGTQWTGGGYSSDVSLFLLVDGEQLNVAQVGPTQLILRDCRNVPPGTPAVIVVRVDGVDSTYSVILHEGCAVENNVVNFREELVPF